jgi:AcrR family transcriptional regulator
MAAKKTAKPKPRAKKDSSLKDRIADCALDLAAREGWEAMTLPRMADAVGEPLGAVIAVFPTTSRIASTLLDRIDQHVLSQVQAVDESETPRDRLFEVLMNRFDALQRHRSGYVALIQGVSRQPSAILLRAPAIVHSMALMLIASGIEASSPLGMARAHALAAAYGLVVRTWLKDDSADMAKTMSALDKNLSRLEKMQSMVLARRPARSSTPEDGAQEG